MIGIIGAMEEETRVLLGVMSDKKTEKIHHLEYTSGKIGETDVVITQSGIGKVNSALATAFLIDRYQADLVINTGSAGAIKSGLAVGDVVVAEQLAYHDVDAMAFGYEKGQVPQMPTRYMSDVKSVEAIMAAAQVIGLNPSRGFIVSSDSFIASKEEINRIRAEFPEAAATEMEGASIAQTCFNMSIPFVVVRAMSDSADEEASMSFDDFIIEAGKKSAEMVIEFVKRYSH